MSEAVAVEAVKDQPVNIPQGRQSFGPYDVPDKAEAVRVYMNRCTSQDSATWSAKSTAIRIAMFASFDGGQSWRANGEVTDEGGVVLDKYRKAELAQTYYVFSVSEGAGRQIRADVDVSNGTLDSKIGVDFV